MTTQSSEAYPFNLVTPEFTATWISAFEPTLGMGGALPLKYRVTMLFDPGEELTELKAVIKKRMIATHGPDEKSWPKVDDRIFSQSLNAAKGNKGYTEGALLVRATSKFQPQVVNINRQPILDPKEIYSGCRMRANIQVVWYTANGSGIMIGLQHLMKVADGEPLWSPQEAVEDAFGSATEYAPQPQNELEDVLS